MDSTSTIVLWLGTIAGAALVCVGGETVLNKLHNLLWSVPEDSGKYVAEILLCRSQGAPTVLWRMRFATEARAAMAVRRKLHRLEVQLPRVCFSAPGKVKTMNQTEVRSALTHAVRPTLPEEQSHFHRIDRRDLPLFI